jgi:hypothetical protein
MLHEWHAAALKILSVDPSHEWHAAALNTSVCGPLTFYIYLRNFLYFLLSTSFDILLRNYIPTPDVN